MSKLNIKLLVGNLGEIKLMTHKYVKRYSTSLIIKELKIKTSMRYKYRLTRMDTMVKIDNTKYRQKCGAIGTH